jgi:hypothetical protein
MGIGHMRRRWRDCKCDFYSMKQMLEERTKAREGHWDFSFQILTKY